MSSSINLNNILDLAKKSGLEVNDENQYKLVCFYMSIKAEMFADMKKSCFEDFSEFCLNLKEVDIYTKYNQ